MLYYCTEGWRDDNSMVSARDIVHADTYDLTM